MKRKYAVAAAVGAVFAIHVACTALYLLPQNPMTRSYIGVVNRYMEPFFAQRWLLFAPEPATSSVKLWSRYQCGGNWTGWRDPAAPLMERHQHNRLSSAGKLLYIPTSLGRELSRETIEIGMRLDCHDPACEAKKNAEVVRLGSFRRAVAWSVRNRPCDASSVQVMVAQLYPTQFSERHKKKAFSFANIYDYPAVAVDASSGRGVE